MRCVYLGLPVGALELVEAGHELLAIGLSVSSPRSDLSRVRAALESSCPLLVRPNLKDVSIAKTLTSTDAELLVCYLWDRIIPASFLEAFPKPGGALNYHPSMLPRHRGADPYFWTIFSGDELAGVTIHWIDPGLDTGPIITQRSVAVSDDETSGELAARLNDAGLELLLRVLSMAEREGLDSLPCTPQNEREATEAPTPSDDLLELDWTRPARELARLVRASSPHPGAFTFLEGRDLALVVHRSSVMTLRDTGALRPGDVALFEEGVTIWTAQGGLVLEAAQLGDEPMRTETTSIASLFPGLPDLRGTCR